MPKDELPGLAFTPCESRKVHIQILTIDTFLFMSHIAILKTSQGKGNGYADSGIRKGKQRADGSTVPDIIRRIGLSKATVYRALNTV